MPGTVLTLGDNAFPDATLSTYLSCYDPNWGRHKAHTYATLGNHEYTTGTAAGAFDYFGDRAGPRGKGYYSFELGAWHVIVLNSNGSFVPFSAGSEQDQWLQADLAKNSKTCTLAVWHHPRFFSSFDVGFTSSGPIKIIWDRLYAAGVDVVLNAQMHHYERFPPMTPDGAVDNTRGIREFNVGTGGESVAMPTVIAPNSEVRGADVGVLKLTLRRAGSATPSRRTPSHTASGRAVGVRSAGSLERATSTCSWIVRPSRSSGRCWAPWASSGSRRPPGSRCRARRVTSAMIPSSRAWSTS